MAEAAKPTTPGTPEPAPALPDPTWSVDDLLLAETARDWAPARDGSFAVWVRSTVEEVEGSEKRVDNLWLSRLAGAEPPGPDKPLEALQLTRGTDRIAGPAPSPGGATVAFVTDREPPGGGDDDDDTADRQLWAIRLAGGEPWPLTRLDRDVAAFGWIDDDTLVVAAAESRSAWERRLEEADDDAVVVEDAEHEPPVRLYRVDLDGSIERLTANTGWVDSIAVAPDGSRAVVTEQVSLSYEFDQRRPPKTALVDLATGATTELFTDGRVLPIEVRWAPDSAGFYVASPYSRHPLYRTATITELWYHHPASGKTTRLDTGPAWDGRGLGGGFAPTPRGVVALAAAGIAYRPLELLHPGGDGSGEWTVREIAGTHAARLDSWEVAPDGRTAVYQHSTATTPPQWWAARLDGGRLAGERRLTDLNAGWRGKPTGRVEVVHWKGALGDEVEGLLHYPLDWPAGGGGEPGSASAAAGRRPLILDIHGGPTGTDRDTWDQRWAGPNLLWRQRGAFVLQANYHGSAGYGLDWAESIEKRYYELEIPDLEAGVDAAIARGLADPERLGSYGWSNGGILTAELITRTHRYRAASIGAADVEWISDWANVDFGASFDNYYFGAAPWEDPQGYIDKSPFFRLTEVTTPTIVYTGTEDRNVPPHQSWSLFRALQQIGRAEVRLVLFPGEPHGLGKIAYQRRKVEEDLAWFDRYLFERPDAKTAAVPEGTPLAAFVARSRAARAGSADGAAGGPLGRRDGGALVPETVRFRGLEVGRFEVTRAQWAAFDPDAAPAPGEDELPAAGVPFERARAYASWLARTTGEPWRLPTAAEAEALAEAAETAGSGGNTLERWTGYPPNPEDRRAIAAELEAAAGRLGRPAPLLLPVGSFPGVGDDPVFDLDGNAAEWAVGDDGAGVRSGPSADRAADPRAEPGPPDPAYVGLRMVKGSAG